ncbi:hypothetical protein [Rhizobium sp. RU36D]|uniref:hypothetical protein n=1 Tax=Rhizobium sp. RU36D TaxID=1907415 RepID=UPI0009D8B406|nr:hypothetical protein [Rhizobium sp. RU36D]SMC90975.1 hypothetical protein SAMN05880593_11024 [Rhizobium sp. RU36D]
MLENVSRSLVAVPLLALLAGCNAGNPGAALGLGQSQTVAAPAASTVAPVGAVVQANCPQISLRENTSYFRTYAKGAKDDPAQVVYQASIADTTRACTKNDVNLGMTIMAQGRVASGPQGKAGTISMPIRVTVMDGDNQVYSELTKMDVAITDPAQPTQFVFTKDNIVVPGNLSNFARVYVGFDESAPKKKK